MHIDLVGRVRNTKLPARHGLMPLFEAVINSIWAIREAKRSDGEITVRIERNPALLTEDAHGNTLALTSSRSESPTCCLPLMKGALTRSAQ
jgi:hypothetical protein